MTEKDEILQKMQEMIDAVKSHKEDPATIDKDKITELFSDTIKEMVEQQVQERIDREPVRKGDPVMAERLDKAGGELTNNRYARIVKDLARDGVARYGMGSKIKPVDFWLAHKLLTSASSQAKMFGLTERINPPSNDLTLALKALTAGGTGTGDELVPRDMADSLWEDFFLPSVVVSNLNVITMPTDPFDIGLGLGDVTWRKGTENVATTASNPPTANSTLTATELLAEVNWSYSLDEDAVVAMMPAVRARLAISGAEIIDDFALNADSTATATGNINSDDAQPAANAYYLTVGQDGIRHQWLVNNSNMNAAAGAALDDDDITGRLADMGKYGVRPTDVMFITDPGTYISGFMSIGTVETVNLLGPRAVVLTGQLAQYRGIPIIVSASHPLSETDGKVSATASSNTEGSISIVNRNMWYVGFKRALEIEVDRDIQKRQFILVASIREAIATHGTRSTATHTSGVRDITI